ncbi:YwpF-like family protein [Pseudogracilibacillus auburnensis]|uniref:YwpF-like family protein n=1 Tax=Pseudogracilibacillus auburnensis TaxID=1494959 RepID=UPI001A9616E8|nr:YwpF-like family protein [Pseudogracilibacillus auburnensis]MBO1004772.1 YwpF-like family protein [Pseudogracilibacillus auburnensis]
MKTFKIVELQVVEDEKSKHLIPLIDGLVINKENENNDWIIEAYANKSHLPFFEKLQGKNNTFEIRVVITHPENDPAPFTVSIHSILPFEDHCSVLFEGKLTERRMDSSELLLNDLIKAGLSGEALLKEFKTRLREK